jgi:hypothetical protein
MLDHKPNNKLKISRCIPTKFVCVFIYFLKPYVCHILQIKSVSTGCGQRIRKVMVLKNIQWGKTLIHKDKLEWENRPEGT